MLAALLSALHVLSLGIGLGAVFSRGLALRALAAGDERAVKRVLYSDNFWGIAALLWIVTGLTRLFLGEKSIDFYLYNGFFWVKMGLFALIFKYVPDAEVRWRDVWLGAAVTAALFTIGKLLLGLYLGKAAIGSSYGAAGSLIALVVWVYYAAQILLLGAEFTQVQARRSGREIRPAQGAIAVQKSFPSAAEQR